MSSALKTELLALLKGSGRFARVWEELDDDDTFPRRLDDDDRALLKRWVNDWTQPEHEVLWQEIEAGARKLGNQLTAADIFLDLIWYTVTAWQIAKGVESGDDPIDRQRQKRREYLLDLADKADALAKYYRGKAEYLLHDANELLMPVLKGAEIRLVRPEITPNSAPPVYSFRVFQHLIRELHERQAEMLRRQAGWEPVSTTVISRKSERRVLKAFLHTITNSLNDLCGTHADGSPHREVIAVLANISFPDENVTSEDVCTLLTGHRAKDAAGQRSTSRLRHGSARPPKKTRSK
jgi:hypothetical protein